MPSSYLWGQIPTSYSIYEHLAIDFPFCLGSWEIPSATVTEGKTIEREAIPRMVNNSLLSEVQYQNTGRAPIEKKQILCEIREYQYHKEQKQSRSHRFHFFREEIIPHHNDNLTLCYFPHKLSNTCVYEWSLLSCTTLYWDKYNIIISILFIL